jgi:hypothetical protein
MEGDVIEAVCQAMSGLRHGSLEIVVHDGRIVQRERREKVRVAPHVRTPKR